MARPMQDCVVLFGDSITSRQDVPKSLQALMGDTYRRTLDILNRGYGGFNTTFTRPLLDQIFARKEDPAHIPVVRLITIWLGTNDAALPPSEQHVPVETYTANLRYFMDELTSSSSPYAVSSTEGLNIVLITPPAMLTTMREPEWNRKPSLTKQYVDACLQVAEEWKAKQAGKTWRVGSIDAWSAIINAAGGEGEELRPFFTDGLHLSTEGYAAVWGEYKKLVKTDFKGRGLDWEDADDLPMRVPLWEDVDYNDPASVVKRMKLPPIRQ